MAKVALDTLHGMGVTPRNYADGLLAELRARMQGAFKDVMVQSVYYQNVLQDNEERVWGRVGQKARFTTTTCVAFCCSDLAMPPAWRIARSSTIRSTSKPRRRSQALRQFFFCASSSLAVGPFDGLLVLARMPTWQRAVQS